MWTDSSDRLGEAPAEAGRPERQVFESQVVETASNSPQNAAGDSGLINKPIPIPICVSTLPLHDNWSDSLSPDEKTNTAMSEDTQSSHMNYHISRLEGCRNQSSGVRHVPPSKAEAKRK